MAKTLEQILKDKGVSQADIDAMKPMLENKGFRDAMEAELKASEVEITRLNGVVDDAHEWYDKEAVPAIKEAQTLAANADAKRAAAEARLATAKKFGLEHVADTQDGKTPEERAAEEKAKLPVVDPRYVTTESLSQFANKETEGMALLADLQNEHHVLFGSHLSARELVNKWKASGAKLGLEQFWETTYGVAGKRAELATKAQQEHDEKIRVETRQQVISERLNPATRQPVASNSPFTSGRGAKDGAKQPWEMSESEKAAARIGKVLKKTSELYVQ